MYVYYFSITLTFFPHASRFENQSSHASTRPSSPLPSLPSTDLGEIVRNILIHFIDQSILFKGYSTDALNSHYGLDTAVMSDIEAAADLPTSPSSNSAPSPSSLAIRRILVKELGVKSELINEEDVEIVKWAVIAVGTRAASMSACAIATVVDHTHSGEEQKESTEVIDVGIDGR